MNALSRLWLSLRRIAPERLLLLALALVAGGLWWAAVSNFPRPLEVVAFAVGDGDALLIRGPTGRTLMIDGGSRTETEVGKRVLAPNLFLLGVHHIDCMLVTHADSDHLNGLADVMEQIPVGEVVTGVSEDPTTAYATFVGAVAEKHLPHHILHEGAVLDLGGGATFHIVGPPKELEVKGTDVNDQSLVGMLEYRGARMLFTGDCAAMEEGAILAHHEDVHADVLKVGHHGSRYSSTAPFLAAVHPSLALISAAGNTEHPHPDTLARLRAVGAQVLRTDAMGRITLTTYGDGWQVQGYRAEALTTRN